MSVRTELASVAFSSDVKATNMSKISIIMRLAAAFHVLEDCFALAGRERGFSFSFDLLELFSILVIFDFFLLLEINHHSLLVSDNGVGCVFTFEVISFFVLVVLKGWVFLVIVGQVLLVKMSTHLLSPEISIRF